MYLPPTTGIRHQANTHPSVPDLPLHGTEPPVPWVLWCPPCQPATLPLCWTACRARVPDCLSAELPSCLGMRVTWPGGGQLHGTDRDVGPSMNTVL